ncbi:MAG TPA: protein kinase [Pirellulaceae bacterium]|nr:protein kinase [Pirellulaceae bacterium]
MNAQDKIDGQADLDQLLEQLANVDASSDAETDSTIRQLRAGLETLAGELRQPPLDDPFLHESALRRGLEFVKANGIQPAPTRPPADLDGSENDLGSVREYRLLSKLGQGGMGTVYKALHTKLDRVVALKVLPADRMQPDTIERFEREMKAVGKLSHPNIVAAHDAREVDGRHYLVMELVDGIDLSQLVRRNGRLRIADACELIRQTAVGLQHAHERGMVHRDIKPSNLMLARSPASKSRASDHPDPSQPQKGEFTAKPTVKILDMGLALLDDQHNAERRELTTAGQTMGTLNYMAPEQGTDSHTVDIRADIYSLGATLYKLLSGESPFPSSKYNTPIKMLTALVTVAAPSIAGKRDDLPPELVAIVDRMLAKQPRDRFDTPADVAEALAPFAEGADLAALLDKVPTEETSSNVDQSALATHESLKSGSVETAPTIDMVNKTFDEELAATGDLKKPGFSEKAGLLQTATAAQAEQTEKRGVFGKSRALTQPSCSGWRNPIIAVATALGGVLLILLAAVVYRIQTDQGTLVVTIEDPAVQAILEKDALVIHDKHSHRTWKITVAETKPLPSGEFQVEGNENLKLLVTDDSGIELTADTFTLKRQGQVRLRVTLEQAARVAAMEPAPSTTSEPDRRAAEWVLSIGGSISIQENGQGRPIGAVGDLPRGVFELSIVNLANNQKVSDAGLAHFRGCKNLVELDLRQTQVTDAGLAHVKECKQITSLDLGGTQVSDAGLAHFQGCKNLTYLYLDNKKVSDAGLAHFKDCKKLKSLHLGYTSVSDAGLVHFQDCKNLTSVDLRNTKVSDAGLANFRDCRNLTTLQLYGPQVTDAGLAHFMDCKNLAYLDLYSTLVSDAGLARFAGYRQLDTLIVTNTAVTETGVEKLSAALPACKIVWDGGSIEPRISTNLDRRADE